MNLSTGAQEGVLTIKVTTNEADYAPEVEKNLKELRRKANIPGFRPGMVPAGVVAKMYGKGVRAEQAYRKANEAVFKHLEDNKIDIMGDVMPSDAQGELDFDDGITEHEFVFEVGLAPEVNLEVNDKDKLTRYKIKPSKEMTEAYKKSLEGKITDPAELDKKVDEMIAADLSREGDFFLNVQLKNHLLAKANLKLPEEFLKRWLLAVNEGKFTMEEIEKDFAPFLRMMSWNVIQRYFADKFDIKVESDDLLAEAKAMAQLQFAQYGMRDVPQDTLEGFAKSILADKGEAQRVFERVLEDKVIDALKPLVKISEKSVTVEEFQKLAAEA